MNFPSFAVACNFEVEIFLLFPDVSIKDQFSNGQVSSPQMTVLVETDHITMSGLSPVVTPVAGSNQLGTASHSRNLEVTMVRRNFYDVGEFPLGRNECQQDLLRSEQGYTEGYHVSSHNDLV